MMNKQLEELARSLNILDARKTLTRNPQVYDVPTPDIEERVTNALTTLGNNELVEQLIYALEKPTPNPLVIDAIKTELKKRLGEAKVHEKYVSLRTGNGWLFTKANESEEEEE